MEHTEAKQAMKELTMMLSRALRPFLRTGKVRGSQTLLCLERLRF